MGANIFHNMADTLKSIEILVGKRFGRLTVISTFKKFYPNLNHNRTWVKALCDCGTEMQCIACALGRSTNSCGCYSKELIAARSITHNLSHHPLYRIWVWMKQRCYNPKNPIYKHYGGRGIKMPEDWQTDFKTFYNWAIDAGWEKGLEIDRINNDGNYEPSNCRCVPHKINSRNTRRTKLTEEKVAKIRLLHSEGVKQSEIANQFSIGRTSINNIIKNRSWL